MVKKEYNNTGLTVGQINRAIDTILAQHKDNYKLEGYFPDAALIRCRNGYNWDLIAEIMWDKVDNGHNDVIIECRDDEKAAIKLQQGDMEKHLQTISNLFMKYASLPEPEPEPLKRHNFKAARSILVVTIFVVIAVAGVIFYLMEGRS